MRRESFSDSLEIERNLIVVTVFLFVMNQTESNFVHKRKEYCHYGHIPLKLEGIKKDLYERTATHLERCVTAMH